MKHFIRIAAWMLFLPAVLLFNSCNKDEPVEVIAGFTFSIDENDYKAVTFTNTSQGYTEVTWDFGDGNTSSEVDPVHTYTEDGIYTVVLTAKNDDGSDVISQDVTIQDTNAALTSIAGTSSKTWKLLRQVSPGRWPLDVGPADRSSVWWAMGKDNDEIALRPCLMNDEWTFNRDGSFTYNSNGDFWAEGGIFEPANDCFETIPANMTGPNGEDQSAFGDATHTFEITNEQLSLIGMGAFIGNPKIGTEFENSVPQPRTDLEIMKLYDGDVDTLILVSNWKFDENSTQPDAYWQITLVHYDNADDEPAVAGFSFELEDKTATFSNNSLDATSYTWDFGDGNTSTEEAPVHTYSSAGVFMITLSAHRGNTTVTAQKEITISGGMSQEDLAGEAWTVRMAANSIFVGPAMGSPDWWQVPLEFMDGSTTGTDDWSCIMNDEFIFNADGTYEYKTNGDARNDGYMGSPNGCWSDAEVAASGNGAAFGSNIHSWSFTEAAASPSERPIITLTNGATGAAFLGFYKGYYGGENLDGVNPPNGGSSTNQYEVINYVNDGGVETMTISVDISEGHDGSASWSAVLVR